MSRVCTHHPRVIPTADVKTIDDMRSAMTEQLSTPKSIKGQHLTGQIIAGLLPNIADALMKDDPALSPPSMMAAVFTQVADKAIASLMEETNAWEQTTTELFPMPPDELQQTCDAMAIELQRKLEEALNGSLPNLQSNPVFLEKKKEVDDNFNRPVKAMLKMNNERALTELAKTTIDSLTKDAKETLCEHLFTVITWKVVVAGPVLAYRDYQDRSTAVAGCELYRDEERTSFRTIQEQGPDATSYIEVVPTERFTLIVGDESSLVDDFDEHKFIGELQGALGVC